MTLDRLGSAVHRALHVHGHPRLGESYSYHAISCHDCSQLLFTPALSPLRSYWQHEKPVLRVGIFDSNLNLWGEEETELRKHLPGRANDTTPVVRRPVPLGKVPEDRTGVTGAQSAGYHVMQCRGVLENVQCRKIARRPKAGWVEPVNPHLQAGGDRIFDCSLLESWIGPSLGD